MRDGSFKEKSKLSQSAKNVLGEMSSKSLRNLRSSAERMGEARGEASAKSSKTLHSEASSASTKADLGPAAWAYRDHTSDFREEIGRIRQFHGVVRMIFNPKDVDEYDEISASLDEALAIFTALPASHKYACDTLNSLGSLKQKRHAYKDAYSFFHKRLEIQESKLANDKGGLAQAYVSLGTLLLAVDVPKLAIAACPSYGARALDEKERCAEALPLFESALKCYVAAFHAKHPKVSWAHEAIAKCMIQLARLGVEELSSGERVLERAKDNLRIARDISKNDERRLAELKGHELALESLVESNRMKELKKASGRSGRLRGFQAIAQRVLAQNQDTAIAEASGGSKMALVIAALRAKEAANAAAATSATADPVGATDVEQGAAAADKPPAKEADEKLAHWIKQQVARGGGSAPAAEAAPPAVEGDAAAKTRSISFEDDNPAPAAALV